jgi:hypothetical protein
LRGIPGMFEGNVVVGIAGNFAGEFFDLFCERRA